MPRGIHPRKTFEISERFFRHVKKSDECWIWTASRTSMGYGKLAEPGGGGWIHAHRFSWEFHNKQKIPKGLFVLHACDNPPCVNPKHLWTGTLQDNLADMHKKNRGAYGERQGRAKLKSFDVSSIRAISYCGLKRQAEIARMFNASPQTISCIIQGKKWRHG